MIDKGHLPARYIFLPLVMVMTGCVHSIDTRLEPLPIAAEIDRLPIDAVLVLPDTLKTVTQMIEFSCDGSHELNLHLGNRWNVGCVWH